MNPKTPTTMKKNFLILAMVAMGGFCFAQNSVFNDSTAVFYISPMYGFYTNSGTTAMRSSPNIEIGLQWNSLSLGLDVGKTHLGQKSGRDTTTYFEIRPNLNVFQQGKFTNTLTFGIGYVPNAQANIMIETNAGIQYSPSPRWSYNIFFGTYYFSGVESARNQNYIGFSSIYYFLPKKKKGFFN
jgi:hypothetical protein